RDRLHPQGLEPREDECEAAARPWPPTQPDEAPLVHVHDRHEPRASAEPRVADEGVVHPAVEGDEGCRPRLPERGDEECGAQRPGGEPGPRPCRRARRLLARPGHRFALGGAAALLQLAAPARAYGPRDSAPLRWPQAPDPPTALTRRGVAPRTA